MKDIKDLSNILNINNQKKEFDLLVDNIISIIKNKTEVKLDKKEVFIKNNIIKIKTNSDKKFVLFLNFNEISLKIKDINQSFILEL